MMRNGILSLILIALASSAWAQRVPDSEQIPVDVRRTTLLVRDVDRALAFWRDALGLTVVYDRVLGEEPNTIHLVLLRANDQFIGNIGIMKRSTDPSDVPVVYEKPTTGEVIFVVNAKDLDERIETIKKVPGVEIESGPTLIEYPTPDGKGKIPVMVTYMWDPDGNYVEVNQILGTPAGMEKK